MSEFNMWNAMSDAERFHSWMEASDKMAAMRAVIVQARTLIREREEMRRPLSLREIRLKRALESVDDSP